MLTDGIDTGIERKHLRKFDPLSVDLGLDARQSSIVRLIEIAKRRKIRIAKARRKYSPMVPYDEHGIVMCSFKD